MDKKQLEEIVYELILDWDSPQWDNKERVHDWKNYISDEVAAMWSTFTDKQKQAIVRQANELAYLEVWD